MAAVLFVAGAVGLAVGFASPRNHGTELVCGALLVALAFATLRTILHRLAPELRGR